MVHLLTLVLLFAGLLAVGDDHLGSSAVDVGMILHHAFDGSIEPEKAVGAGKAVLNSNKKAEFAAGILNNGLKIGVDAGGKEFHGLALPAEKNIPAEAGTICFWLKPEDWTGSDAHFQLFVGARRPNGALQIYKYQNGEGLQFWMQDDGIHSAARGQVQDWKPGQWHHVACVWNRNELILYGDGRRIAGSKRNHCSLTPYQNLYVGTLRWGNERGFSIIDELKIFNRAYSSQEVRKEYERLGGRTTSEGPLHLTIGEGRSRLDGRVEDAEYSMGGQVFFTPSGSVLEGGCSYGLSYDEEYLYVGVKTPVSPSMKTGAKMHDEAVWSDDSVEIWLGHRKNDLYQFIVNSAGVVCDLHRTPVPDIRWDARDCRVVSRVHGGSWHLEAAIPWKAVGGKPNPEMPFLLNIGRTTTAPRFHIVNMSCLKKYEDVDHFASVCLGGKIPRYCLQSIGNLRKGALDLKVALEQSRPAAAADISFILPNGIVALNDKLTEQNGYIGYGRLGLAREGTLKFALRGGGRNLLRLTLNSAIGAIPSVQYIYTDIEKQKLCSAVKNEGARRGNFRLFLRHRVTGKIFRHTFKVGEEQVFFTDEWGISSFPVGFYDYWAEFVDESGECTEGLITYYYRFGSRAPWDGNQIGLYPGEVPPPWTAMKISGSRVSMRMQKYAFAKNILPSSFEAGGMELLNRPCELRINGAVVSEAQVSCLSSAPDQIRLQAGASAGQIQISCRITMEYDGYLWQEITLDAGSSVKTISSLVIDIPLRKDVAEQVHCNEDKIHGKFGLTGLVGSGWQKNLYTKPTFWVGNDRAGLSWYAESLKNWKNKDRNSTVRILPGRTESIVRLQIVDCPLTFSGKRTIAFGMQGTPTKPLSRKRLFNPVTPTFKVSWWPKVFEYFNYHNFTPEFFNEDFARETLRKLKKQGTSYMHYIGSNGVCPGIPEWGYFAKYWTSNPLGASIVEGNYTPHAARSMVWTYACLNSRSFMEFMLYQVDRLTDNPMFQNKAFYYDLVGPRLCNNTEHGCGWRDDEGHLHPTYNIRGAREFHKRIYHLLKKKDPNSWHSYHITGQPAVSAVHSFADELLGGETWYGEELPQRRTYAGIFTPEQFRVDYYAQKWGQIMLFCCQLRRTDQYRDPAHEKYWGWGVPEFVRNPRPEILKACLHFLGYCMVHDVKPYDCGTPVLKDRHQKCWLKQREFLGGWDEKVRFIPYWNAGEYYEVQSAAPSRVMVSAYVRNQSAVLYVMNDTDESQDVTVKVKGGRLLNQSGVLQVDDLCGRVINADSGVIRVTVPPRIFVMRGIR